MIREMSKSIVEDKHVYLRRENAHTDINGMSVQKKCVCRIVAFLEIGTKKIVPCSSFRKYQHSPCKGQDYFFCSQCDDCDNLQPHKKTKE